MNTIKLIIVAGMMMLTASAAQAQINQNEAIKISAIKAYLKSSRLHIDWTADAASANYFEVQKSDDGNNFTTIALVMGPDPRKTANEFGYVATNQKNNQATYFRLKHIDNSGNELLSEVFRWTLLHICITPTVMPSNNLVSSGTSFHPPLLTLPLHPVMISSN